MLIKCVYWKSISFWVVHLLLGFSRRSYWFIASSDDKFFCSIALCNSFFSLYFGSPSSSGCRWLCHSLRPSGILHAYCVSIAFQHYFSILSKIICYFNFFSNFFILVFNVMAFLSILPQISIENFENTSVYRPKLCHSITFVTVATHLPSC